MWVIRLKGIFFTENYPKFSQGIQDSQQAKLLEVDDWTYLT